MRPNAAAPGERPWTIVTDDGSTTEVDAAIATCPVPQSFSLIVDSGAVLPSALRGTDYDRTLALLAVLDGPSSVPPPGGLQQPDETFTFVADNQQKGLSAVPALTLHANAEWSDAWWDRPRERGPRRAPGPRQAVVGRVDHRGLAAETVAVRHPPRDLARSMLGGRRRAAAGAGR